jgi:hypothetical protein
MKLLEVAPDFVRSQVGTLMTILQFLQSKTEPGAKIPMQNVTNLMNNAGYPFDWRTLDGLKKKYKALDELIGSYDEDSLTIGSSEEEPESGNETPDIEMGNQEPDMGMAEPQMGEPGMGMEEPQAEPEVDIADGRSPERVTVDKMAARAARF